jgi:hypothetical protein
MKRTLIALICHASACLLFVIANDLGITLYEALFGPSMTRGIAPGQVVRLAWMLFALANTAMALLPSVVTKVLITFILTVLIVTLLLPAHPLRAFFYAGLSAALSLLAITVSQRLSAINNARTPCDSHIEG